MLYTNVCLGSQTLLFTSEIKGKIIKKKGGGGEGRERNGHPSCTLWLWRCLQTVLFTSKSDQSCFVLHAKYGLSEASELVDLSLSHVLPPGHPTLIILSPQKHIHLLMTHLRKLKLNLPSSSHRPAPLFLCSTGNLLRSSKVVVKVSATVISKCRVTGNPYSELAACARCRDILMMATANWLSSDSPQTRRRCRGVTDEDFNLLRIFSGFLFLFFFLIPLPFTNLPHLDIYSSHPWSLSTGVWLVCVGCIQT